MKKALLFAVSGIFFAASAAADTPTIVASTYGFNQQAFRERLFDPFEKECGCKVVVEVGNNAGRLAKLKANKSNYDLAVFADFGAREVADLGLIQPIDVSKLSNYGKIYDFAKDPIGGNLAVGYTTYSTSLVYRTDKIEKVESWNDLFSDTVKGRVAIPNISTTQGPLILHMLSKAMGKTNVDFADAIARLGSSKDDIVTFYERSSQLITLFAQDEVWMAPVGRFAWGRLLKTGMPLGWSIPKEGQTGGMNVMVMVKGTEHPDLVLKLMDKWLSTEVQTSLAEGLIDSPVNKEVKVDAKTAELLTYGSEQIDAIDFLPAATILEQREGWVKAWNQGIAN